MDVKWSGNKKWDKREDLFKKFPIFVSKKKTVLIFAVLASFFFFYQFIFVLLLSESEHKNQDKEPVSIQLTTKPITLQSPRIPNMPNLFNKKGIIRGTRLADLKKYKPNGKGMFTCFKSGIQIEYSYVNDNYCDCPDDGSDEPGTNACDEGKFYCSYQRRHNRGSFNVLIIPSSRVNDGICDCCDGSDEWNNATHPHPLPYETQRRLGKYQAPCPNLCLG